MHTRLTREQLGFIIPPAPPAGDAEMRLRDIFETALDVSGVGCEDDFFDLGGDSLKAEELALSVEAAFGVRFQTSEILAAPTVQLMATRVVALLADNGAAAVQDAVLSTTTDDGSGSPILFVHGLNGSALFVSAFSEAMTRHHPLYVARGIGLFPGEDAAATLDTMVDRYIDGYRKTHGDLPRNIGGLCMGGYVALAIAERVHAETGDTPNVILLDPPMLEVTAGNTALARKRHRQITVKIAQEKLLLAALDAAGLGGGRMARSARLRLFKRAFRRSLLAYRVPSFPCRVLYYASAERVDHAARDIDAMRRKAVTFERHLMPGDHDGFSRRNIATIEKDMVGFLGGKPRPALSEASRMDAQAVA